MFVTRMKIGWIGVLLILLGIMSYVAERVFYNTVDKDGVLQESFFLPLAFILGILGLIVVVVGFCKRRQ